MSIVHKLYEVERTIAAIATPPGEGGVAIVRISGKEALQVASRSFSGPIYRYKSHTAHRGQVVDKSGQAIDDAIALVMLAPRSYTGEDTVEIHCHGGVLITRRVLEAVLDAGAAPARPGEFTFKAFMNGKIDLAQAEAVQELIAAKNELATDAAQNQLQGLLSKKVRSFQHKLTHIAAMFEAWVDFPEEGLEFAPQEQVYSDLLAMGKEIEALIATFREGKIIHDGISLCFVGAPNVGKSSLMNALLDKERAIVSPLPGTTRDLVEDQIRLNGLNLRLVDTAGIRQSEEPIEQEGIRRSLRAMSEADLILLVLDATAGISAEERVLMQQIPARRAIAVWNKSDLPHSLPYPTTPLLQSVAVSAVTRQGLSALHGAIDRVIWGGRSSCPRRALYHQRTP